MSEAAEASVTLDPIPYEGYEIHVTVEPAKAVLNRYTYVAYVCHPGANAALSHHTVPFHPNGEESFASVNEARQDAKCVGQTIVDGSHADLSVLSLVTSGY